MFKVIVIIFFNLTIVFSQNINELFDDGNEFYSQNNYKEAISNYERILENGYFSEDLYLNLGNAYFHESNFGKARWSYEMGLKLNPINSDLKNNNNVNKIYIDGYIELPKNNLIDIINLFFQAEDGIRDLRMSRGLGDVYKRQEFSLYFLYKILIAQLLDLKKEQNKL